jgi:hypothetical protein
MEGNELGLDEGVIDGDTLGTIEGIRVGTIEGK